MPTDFMGATGAVLFPSNTERRTQEEQLIDTRGSLIENELMDLMDNISNISSLTFIGSSEEEENNPFFGAKFANVEGVDTNSYGRPVQRVEVRTPPVVRKIVNPPIIPSNRSAFSLVIPEQQRTSEMQGYPVMQANYSPRPIPIYPNNWNNMMNNQPNFNAQVQFQQQGLPNGPILQMNLPVMPKVAGYCSSGCSQTYDQIAVETLTTYVAWSEYPEVTIRDPQCEIPGNS